MSSKGALTLVFKQEASEVLMTDSRRLAEGFDSRHRDVMRKIEDILSETPNDFKERNFSLVDFIDKSTGGAETVQRYYQMTKDGFMHVGLTFTGKKGNEFRIKVIEMFNQMEQELLLSNNKLPSIISADMMQLMANSMRKVEEERDFAVKTKHWISDKKTASSMGKLGATVIKLKKATEKVKELEDKLGDGENWHTISGWKRILPELKGWEELKLGQAMSRYCKANNLEIRTIPDPRFGKLNMYCRETILKFISSY